MFQLLQLLLVTPLDQLIKNKIFDMDIKRLIKKKNIVSINHTQNFSVLLKKLNKCSIKTCFILNKKKLIGSLTDGDIRRQIFKNISLKSKTIDICNKNPKKIIITDKKFKIKIKKYFKKFGISIFPVVNKNQKYLGYIKYEDIKNNFDSVRKFDVIIMAGGLGKRLRPLTYKIPKPLIKINNISIIERIIQNLDFENVNKIYITLFYKSKLIIDYFKKKSLSSKLYFIVEKKPLDTAGSLLNLKNNLCDNILIINSDVVSKINIKSYFQYHIKNRADITLCSKKYDIDIPYGVLNLDNNKITSITEKPKLEYWINTGIYFLNSKILDNLKKEVKIDIVSLINKFIFKKLKVFQYPMYETWFDVGTPKDLKETKNYIKKYF